MFYLQLVRIEMTGFKSFADKTIIEFDKGVTAIVGPNGSGKSNLSEAVRWVLGEQSARNLRGKKMNDIVFSGSQSRKPINIAEVTLVLNNEDRTLPIDFTEVSLTRRINRNGDSDCFINKKPCRLKDITDLLMDSGIGKDSFSMISQGKVEQIFQNKPEERRSIFEDAAGIAKYKNRKVNAERKLSDTQEHLNRVEDILHEITNQLEPLEKQRNTALLYKEKRAALSEIEIALIAVEIETLNEQWQLGKKEIEHYQEQLTNLESRQKQLKASLADSHQHAKVEDEALDKLQDEYVAIVRKIEQLEGQKNILDQKAGFSAKNKEDQERLLAEKKQLIEKEAVKLAKLREEIALKQTDRKELEAKVEELLEKVSQLSADKNEHIQQLRDTYIDTLQDQSSNKNTILQLEKDVQQAEDKYQNLQSKIAENSQGESQKADLVRNLEAQYQELENQLTNYQDEEKIQAKALADHEAVIKTYSEELLTLSRNLQQAEARKESQQELEDSYASYYQGVKEILKRRDKINGVRGPVGELFHVPDTYTLAIDTALGTAIQHIVVDDTEAASTCINILKRNRLGRATFLPLTVIKPRQMPSYLINELQSIAGFIGIASDLITFDTSYQAIAENLLGTTIIAENLQAGVAISKRIENRYRIVSLEGDVIHAGGSMTGGASKKQQSASVFSRKNSIQKLTDYIDEHTLIYKTIEEKYRNIQEEVTKGRNRYAFLQQEKSKLGYELDNLASSKKREEDSLKQLQEELLTYRYEAKLVQTQLEQMTTDLDTARQQSDKLTTEIGRLKQTMADSTLNEEERQKLLQSLQQTLQQDQQSLAVVKEQEKQLRRDIANTKELVDNEVATVTAIEASLEESSKVEHTEFQSIDDIVEQLTLSKKDKQHYTLLLKEKRDSKKQRDQEVEEKNNQLQETNEAIKSALEKLAKLESSSGRFEVAIDHHLNRLSEEYELTYEAARQDYPLQLSIEESSQKVKQLKNEINHLGPINLTSIEEYDRIFERYEFLSKQQEDLLEAKATLLQAMEEIDEEVSQRFETTFMAIKNQFEQTFPRLFGGGKATIELTDPSNLLETGIEIVAQPPGKKRQHLSLLSGGEKAFTAIALLFSIIEVSPVPFCILDEVEAALDEANVVRFGKYLTSFESNTQFIVITHRKGTMEEADVLYGVTMQDSGVSRLASVKFNDEDDE